MCMHMIIVRCFCFQKKRNVKVQVSTQSKTFKNQGCQTEESYLKDSARPQLENDIEMEDDCLDLNWEPGIKKEDVGVTVTLSPPCNAIRRNGNQMFGFSQSTDVVVRKLP